MFYVSLSLTRLKVTLSKGPQEGNASDEINFGELKVAIDIPLTTVSECRVEGNMHQAKSSKEMQYVEWLIVVHLTEAKVYG